MIIEDNHNAFCYNEHCDLKKNFHEWYRMCDVKNPYDEWINGIVFIIPILEIMRHYLSNFYDDKFLFWIIFLEALELYILFEHESLQCLVYQRYKCF